jgi:hypothetical protein
MASSILSTRYYDETTDEYKWLTHSTVNSHIFFCEECCEEHHSSERRCDACLKTEQMRDLAERFYLGECYAEHDEGYAAAKAWFLGELGEPPTLEQAYYLGKKLLTWYDYSGEGDEHVCSGAFEYRPEERVCDKSDDPRCPQHIGGWLF